VELTIEGLAGSSVSVNSAELAALDIDFSAGAFKEVGLTLVATIDYTSTGGGKSVARATGVDIHAYSTYVCDEDKSCSPYQWVSDSSFDASSYIFYDTCFQ